MKEKSTYLKAKKRKTRNFNSNSGHYRRRQKDGQSKKVNIQPKEVPNTVQSNVIDPLFHALQQSLLSWTNEEKQKLLEAPALAWSNNLKNVIVDTGHTRRRNSS